MRCLKCGTPFCRRCHLGAAVAGLCSQCYHLFVVRDGVSGPARNRKLLEVQAEEGRQGQAFRLLSLLLPGAAQVYRGRALPGSAAEPPLGPADRDRRSSRGAGFP